MTTYKLTQAHFDRFKTFVELFVNILGLTSWKLVVLPHSEDNSYDPDDPESGYGAATVASSEDRLAVIYLCLDWDTDPDEDSGYSLAQTAFHECLELLTWKISEMTEHRASEEIHVLIRTLENVWFPELWMGMTE